jgi:transcription antitermination factor NusA-like protein
MKYFIVLLLLIFNISKTSAQYTIKGHLIDSTTKVSIPTCTIILNDQKEFYSDTSGNFSIKADTNKTQKIKFLFLGYYPLVIENITCTKDIVFETVAIATLKGREDEVIINNRGRINKKATEKLKKENVKIIEEGNNGAYLVFNGLKYYASKGIIKLK